MQNYQVMNRPHSFLQSLEVRFEFRKSRVKDITKASLRMAKYDGVIQVIFTINRTRYQPYTTDIKTTRAIWDGRKAQRVSPESRELNKTLFFYESLAESAFEKLLKLHEFIDGELLINGLRNPEQIGNEKSLADLYQEFMIAKKALIVSDQHKRSDTQISLTTYETYPKRWLLIQGYLVSIKRPKLPLSVVRYDFATNLKEWLTKQRKTNGDPYNITTINKVISLLKMLMNYGLSKGYTDYNHVYAFPCRGSSPANPKPLSKAQMEHLETCELPAKLRHACDSWLVAAELCLHYSDYMKLPVIKFIDSNGVVMIQHSRSKQTGSSLKQTVNVTARVERIVAKWGGIEGLYYVSNSNFNKVLKQIAKQADLRDSQGGLIDLEFSHGRDTGLTDRAIEGANSIQLSKMAGWSRPTYAERYIGNPEAIVESFARSSQALSSEPVPPRSESFIKIHKTA